MSYNYSATLNPEKALIWRIVHRDNIPWLLDNGLHCGNSTMTCPTWIPIGNPELISKRATHPVPFMPGGYLNDYVPFYFTPFSPMLLNITSGRGVPQRTSDQIVLLVSSLHRVRELGLNYLFTDMHAYYQWASFYHDLADLQRIDWPILQARNFSRDVNDPAKFERYQAEALIYRHCPVEAVLGMICYDDNTLQQLKQWLGQRQLNLPVHARPDWYFS